MAVAANLLSPNKAIGLEGDVANLGIFAHRNKCEAVVYVSYGYFWVTLYLDVGPVGATGCKEIEASTETLDDHVYFEIVEKKLCFLSEVPQLLVRICQIKFFTQRVHLQIRIFQSCIQVFVRTAISYILLH